MSKKLQAAMIVAFLVAPARADDPVLATLLAQQCVAEVSLAPRIQVPPAQRRHQKVLECQAMWHVLAAKVDYDRARLAGLVLRYNTLFKRGGSTRRRWVLELQPGSDAPPSWPRTASWRRHRPMWEAVMAAAEAFVRDPGQPPCPRADHFGGRCDDDAHACDPVPPCWERQWCGRPRSWWSQAYWRRQRCAAVVPAVLAGGGAAAHRGSDGER